MGRHKWRGLWALAVGAMAGIAATAAAAPAGATSPEWRVFTVLKPGSAVFNSAVATGPANAWAVGEVNGKTFSTGPIAAHWDGVKWSPVTIPGSAGYTLREVAASSASNVWVTAMRTTSNSTTMFRFDGAHWHTMTPPDYAGSLLVLGTNDVWLTGASGCDYAHNVPYDCMTEVWHWNGSHWTDHKISAYLYGLTGSSDRDLWAVTYTGVQQAFSGPGTLTAYNWNGSTWLKAAIPSAHGDVGYGAGIAMDGSKNVWITALNVPDTAAVILHLAGGRWQKFSGPATFEDPTPDGQGGMWLGTGDHWTGGTWVDTSAVGWPTNMTSAGIGEPVRIPGAPGSFWATGYLQVTPPGISGAAIYLYGPTPRG